MFQSQAQRRFMYAKHPKLAKEFESKTPKGKKLPERKKIGRGHWPSERPCAGGSKTMMTKQEMGCRD